MKLHVITLGNLKYSYLTDEDSVENSTFLEGSFGLPSTLFTTLSGKSYVNSPTAQVSADVVVRTALTTFAKQQKLFLGLEKSLVARYAELTLDVSKTEQVVIIGRYVPNTFKVLNTVQDSEMVEDKRFQRELQFSFTGKVEL